MFKKNLIPDINSPSPTYLTSYGAIKIINTLGPAYILDIIVPVMDKILAALNIKNCIRNRRNSKGLVDNYHASEFKQNIEHAMTDSIDPCQMQSVPQINFSFPLITGHIPIVSSMFSEISNTYVIDAKTAARVEPDNERDGDTSSSNTVNREKKMFYVYYALKVKEII